MQGWPGRTGLGLAGHTAATHLLAAALGMDVVRRVGAVRRVLVRTELIRAGWSGWKLVGPGSFGQEFGRLVSIWLGRMGGWS